MIKIFLSIILFFIPLSVSAASEVNDASDDSTTCSKLALTYANSIAEIQFPKTGKKIKAPFKEISVDEVPSSYFKEAGNAKNIIYGVALKSSDKWDCQYYVTLSNEAHNRCDFKKVELDHCVK
jgi:hypothetical protein